ncbi:hypothetical protein U1Q18_041670, partial [Sarracenia purpurea var. burkii]
KEKEEVKNEEVEDGEVGFPTPLGSRSETEDALGGVSGIYSRAGTVKGANLDANHGSASESEGDSGESRSESEGKVELDIAKINMVSMRLR